MRSDSSQSASSSWRDGQRLVVVRAVVPGRAVGDAADAPGCSGSARWSPTCSRPWKSMCSNRCAKPVRPGRSFFEPTWYQRLTATSGRRGSGGARPGGRWRAGGARVAAGSGGGGDRASRAVKGAQCRSAQPVVKPGRRQRPASWCRGPRLTYASLPPMTLAHGDLPDRAAERDSRVHPRFRRERGSRRPIARSASTSASPPTAPPTST